MQKKSSAKKEPGFIDNIKQCSREGVYVAIVCILMLAGAFWFISTDTFIDGMGAALKANANNVARVFCDK